MERAAIKLISVYQCTLSLLIGNQCRFYPSCSHYTQEAIARHGLIRGCGLGAKRILSCHPWHPGGIDLVPEKPDRSPSSRNSTQ
ncbi:MAG: membrane protein insertion efficiency factor YidD [Pseudomonadales bacterium]|nr:membrane protein insertion efficiency factor YidD [Pseudomonadales bacterium]